MINPEIVGVTTNIEFGDLLDIRQKPQACVLAVCRQIAWLLDRENVSLEQAEADLSWKPDEPIEEMVELEWLLNRGYKVDYRTAFDIDRLLTEGLTYALEFYKDRDPETIKSLYSPDYLATVGAEVEDANQRVAKYPKYKEMFVSVTKEEVIQHLQAGGLVSAASNNGAHRVLLWSFDNDDFFGIYEPQHVSSNDSGIGYIPNKLFEGVVQLEHPTLLISR